MRRSPLALRDDRRGAVAMLTAICLMALMASAALCVDLGHVFLRSRQLQGVADLAAMAAVQSLDATGSGSPAAAAAATASLNRWPGAIQAEASTGVYSGDAAVAAGQRFTATTASPNAVQVTLRAPVPLYFAGLLTGSSTLQVTRTATAARAQYAAFSIGSGLAALNGGIANAMLSTLSGSQVSLSLANYQALAAAQIDLLRYIPALQTRAGLQGLSFTQVLSTSIAPSVALNALADTLAAEGQQAAAASVRSLAAASSSLPSGPLSGLLDLGPYGAQDHVADTSGAALTLGAFDLAEAVLAASDGSRQLSLSLNGLAPGLVQLSATLAIGQRANHSPWLTVTNAGQVVVRTAQLRLYLQAGLAPGALSGVDGGSLIILPVFLEAASAQAKLQDMNCPAVSADQDLDLLVSPSLGTLAIAQADTSALADFATPVPLTTATLVNSPALRATAYGRADLGAGDASWQSVHFSQADVSAGTVKSVYAADIARATLASVLGETVVSVQTSPGSANVSGGVSPTLQATLTQAAPSLDAVIAQIEALSGVRLGEADVQADGLRCRGAALVA